MSTTDGLQVPEIGGESLELVGNVGAVPPSQNGGGVVKLGVTGGFTVMVKGTAMAHCPGSGVKV